MAKTPHYLQFQRTMLCRVHQVSLVDCRGYQFMVLNGVPSVYTLACQQWGFLQAIVFLSV
jgi:hypothetical protein